ncbi:MAG: hypothetical protein NVS3B12_31350 [Acidimicrobiales bacterium]
MRKIIMVGVAAGTLAAGVAPASAGTSTGTYETPFRADGAHYNSRTDTFSGGTYLGQPTDKNGCAPHSPTGPAGNPDAYRCTPAAGSIVQLADGRILFWDALEGTENLKFGSTDHTVTDGGRLTVNDESRLLTLGSNGPSFATPGTPDGGAHQTTHAEDLPLPAPIAARHYPYNDGAMFCSDQVILGDGSVMDVGGTNYYSEPYIPAPVDKGVIELEGLRNARVFDPSTNSWRQTGSMHHGRWYPGLVTLGNGNVFVASGVTKLIKPVYPSRPEESGRNVAQTETYNTSNGTWIDNGPSADRPLPLFPRLHLLPNGHVYYDAAGQAFNPSGQSTDEAMWNVAGSYDPGTKKWTDLGVPGATTGAPTPYAGFRGSTFSAPLALRPDKGGNYNSASFLTAGGVLLPTPGSYVSVDDSRINTVTTGGSGGTAASDQLKTISTGPLNQRRWYGSAVPLPDGTVYAVDGADIDEVITPGYESPIRAAEVFTPKLDAAGNYAGGTWKPAGEASRKRTYHNTAILRPDGSIMIAGHAPIPSGYNQVSDGPDLPGRPGTNNSHDPSFQIYKPAYFNEHRPVVDSLHQDGGTVVVNTPDAAKITSVVMIRNTAQTHLVDGDGRTVVLPVLSHTATSVTVQLPASTNVLPNGPYLLFANQMRSGAPDSGPGNEVPSIGRQVMVTGTSVPTLTSADMVGSGGTVQVAGHRPARHTKTTTRRHR